MPRSKSLLRAALLSALVVLSPPVGYLGLHYAVGNIHEVVPGGLYRSGQLDGAALRQLVQSSGIRTIVNLRGAHPGERWYDEEAALARENGIRYVAIAISARSEPDMAQMIGMARALQDAPGPILVHCMGGADRSGLASAIYQLVVEGRNEEEAAAQLSIQFGHFPWLGSETGAMDRAFASFAAYWSERARSLVASDER
jgi:protein tyrosine/serine phosphatase